MTGEAKHKKLAKQYITKKLRLAKRKEESFYKKVYKNEQEYIFVPKKVNELDLGGSLNELILR